jgi:hypothetical protein
MPLLSLRAIVACGKDETYLYRDCIKLNIENFIFLFLFNISKAGASWYTNVQALRHEHLKYEPLVSHCKKITIFNAVPQSTNLSIISLSYKTSVFDVFVSHFPLLC